MDKLLVGCPTKNCGKYIAGVLENIEKYCSLFNDYEVFTVDGFSTDSTMNTVVNWCNEDWVRRRTSFQRTQGLPRMESLVEARNMLVDLFRPQFGKNVYFLMLDADSPNASPLSDEDLEGFLFAFQREDWAAVFCSQRKKYYDIWTLRDSRLDEDYQVKFKGLSWRDGSMQRALEPYERPIPPEVGFWPVRSAYGGAALYKTEYLENARFNSTKRWVDDDGEEHERSQCEIVGFNECIDGKMYINAKWFIGDHE